MRSSKASHRHRGYCGRVNNSISVYRWLERLGISWAHYDSRRCLEGLLLKSYLLPDRPRGYYYCFITDDRSQHALMPRFSLITVGIPKELLFRVSLRVQWRGGTFFEKHLKSQKPRTLPSFPRFFLRAPAMHSDISSTFSLLLTRPKRCGICYVIR